MKSLQRLPNWAEILKDFIEVNKFGINQPEHEYSYNEYKCGDGII